MAVGPRSKIKVLRPHERCLLHRRRAKMTQEEVANKIKVCRLQLNRMESGKVDCTKLLNFWE